MRLHVAALAAIAHCAIPAASSGGATFGKLDCLTGEQVESVRRNPESGMPGAFSACRIELGDKLETLNLTEPQLRVAFASILAHAMAPYGESVAVRLDHLLHERNLDCDNYAMLTGYLHRLTPGRRLGLKFVGFDGGFVGNHAQIIAESDSADLLLDPTIGLVARLNFDQLLRGEVVAHSRIRVFQQHNDTRVDQFARTVVDALANGRYRPSNLLYYFSSLEDYVAFVDEGSALRKSDINAFLRRYVTPGAQALKRRLTNHH
jgi:hypothetical protein